MGVMLSDPSPYNCDETGVTTVQRPVKELKVLAGKGIKQVRSMTSQEKGQLVNAVGNTVPPFMVFPVSTSSLTC